MKINNHPYRNGQGVTFLVWCPERGEDADDAHEVLAWDAEEAAEDYGDRTDAEDSDYVILNSNDGLIVFVRAKEDGSQVKRFRVTGEAVPQYSAREEDEEP